MSAPVAATDGRRAVGARNAEAILEAAVRVLGADPSAGMGEIAAAAGVGRATLYRHYDSREHLIEALLAHVGEINRAHLDELAADDGGEPEAALLRFVEQRLALRDQYHVLAPFVTPAHGAKGTETMRAPVAAWMRRAVAAGLVADDVEPAWLVASLRAQIRAAGEELDAGRLARAAAAGLVVRAVLHGAGPR